MEVDIYAGRHCILVARYFCRSKFHSTHKAPVFVIPFRRFTYQPHFALLPLSLTIQEDTLHNDADAGTRMIKVKFVLRRRCEFGQQFYVIGDNQLLGGWDPEAAIPMKWSEGHVWTLQLDLLSGTYAEFKVLLKADEDVLEWQPGPNRRLKVSDSKTSLLVFIPWCDGEDTLENEAPRFLEMNDSQRTRDIVKIASSVRSPSDVVDNVGDVDLETDAITSLDITDKPKTEEMSAVNKTVISNAKAVVEEKQSGAKGQITGHRELLDEGAILNSKPSEDFLTSYPIPESWYDEESSDIQVTHKITEPSPALLAINATGRTPISATESLANKVDKAGEKPPLQDKANELIAEGTSVEAIEENDEQCTGKDVPAIDMMASSNEGTVLSYAEREDIHKGSAQKAVTEDGPNGAFAEPKKEFIVDPAVLHNEVSTADEQLMAREDPNEASRKAAVDTPAQNELPGSEVSNVPSETIETKSAKDKRWGREGWSKLWGAIVQGRIG